jgi:hypothetical protein
MWFSCKIERVGPAEDGAIYIWLNDTGGAFNHWFRAVDSMKREMLATALTAISTNGIVEVTIAATTEYSQVNRMYLKRSVSE